MDAYPVDKDLLQKYRESVNLASFPRQAAKYIAELGDEYKDWWYRERFLCLKYPLYLSGFHRGEEDKLQPMMGMDFQTNPHEKLFQQFVQNRPGEGLVLSDLEKLTKKMMILWPRGVFKTSAVVVDVIQTILNYPNVRICFLTGGDQLAKRQLGRIKKFFENPTPRFKFLFPEFCLKSVRNRKIQDDADPRAWSDVPCKMGTKHEFTVPCRTNDTFAEPTFAISTAKSVKAGAHFDKIYIDDLVNETNYRSVPALEKCYQDYIDICPLLEPTGFMVLTGTRYSFGDTYERIQELAKKEERETGRTIWKFSIRDCWSMGCQNCEHTDVYHNYDVNILQPPCSVPGCACPGFQPNGTKGVLFPETRTLDGRSIGHTLEWLEGEKLRVGEEFFANQYENKPIATGAQTFSETLIGAQTLHELNQVPAYNQSFTFIVGDLAYVGQPDRDNSVLYACRLFQGQIFVFDCDFGTWDSGQVADHTVDFLLKHRPNVLYYEKFNGWDAYNTVITAHAATRGVTNVPIQWEKGSQAKSAKMIRIGTIKAPLSARRLWLYAGMRGYLQLVQQLVKWPKLGRHDDFADTLGMVVAAPTGYQLVNPPTVVSTSNWLRRLNATEVSQEPDTRPAGSYDPEDETDRWRG